jgi:hypothetical protein
MFKIDRKDADARVVAAQAVKPPPEPPKIEVAPDPVERRLLYTLQDSMWHEANGEIRTAPQYSQVSVPEAIAVVAIKNNLAADFHTERGARLIECFGINYGPALPDTCVDPALPPPLKAADRPSGVFAETAKTEKPWIEERIGQTVTGVARSVPIF